MSASRNEYVASGPLLATARHRPAVAAALRGSLGRLASGVALASTYFIAARIGFEAAVVAEQITTVWAPTGIALGGLLLGGLRLWPAVWAGAFAANALAEAPLWTALILATGNTLEAVTAAWVLRLRPRFGVTLRRSSDVLAFGAVAAGLCTTLSATVGVVTLCAAGVQPWDLFSTLWFDWWLGDALGAIIVGTTVLTVAGERWTRGRSIEAVAYAAGSALLTHLVFGPTLGLSMHPLEFVVFPIAIVAAVFGGPAVTSLVVLSASAVAIAHTVHGGGPFAGADLHRSLILLQVFMGVLAGTAFLLAAAIAEREAAERRAREAADRLAHREQMLRLAQHSGGIATFEWDFRNQIAHCSPEFFKIFGLSTGDGLIAMSEWGRFVHPDDRDRMAAHLAAAISGAEPAVADYRIVAADGRTRWLSYAGQILKTPDGERMLGTVVDITDRVNVEMALRESRDVLSLAMRGGSMGAWSRNLETNEVWWSRELEEIVGLQPGAFGRTEAGFFEFVHQDDRALVREAVDHAVTSGADYIVEFRFRHADGEWRWMEGRGRAVYGPDGMPRTLYGIGIDVTGRKRAEIALREAKQAAESANQLKDQFLATLSHELRTPLNAILGYVHMLRVDALPPERRANAVDVIGRNAALQHQLVEDLLDMSGITTGKVRLNPEHVAVAAVLKDAMEGVKPAAEAKGIVMTEDIESVPIFVFADRTRLQQVFWNLLTNAIKFTTRPAGRISVRLRSGHADVEVEISDTGVGIAPEFLPFVFEPFRQGDARFDRGYGGLGLGLAICKQLVELHGGTIRGSSAGVGEGATFVVRLPRADRERSAS